MPKVCQASKSVAAISGEEGSRLPSPVNLDALLAELEGYDPIIIAQLRLGFLSGFDLGFRGTPNSNEKVKNLSSAYENPEVVNKYLNSEIDSSRIIGPFDRPPFSNFQINPLGVVPKKESGKFRIINDLSNPAGDSINDKIDRVFTEVQYASVLDAVDLVSRNGPGCYLAKSDIQKAFRLLPVRPDQRNLLGMVWEGSFYFDCCLPMGASSSCQLFERFSSAVEFMANKRGVRYINHYLDDFLLANTSKESCQADLDCFKQLCSDLHVPLAIDKTVGPSQILVYLGFEFNTVNTTVSLPQEKLSKAQSLISQVLSCKRPQVSQLMSLLGLLSFSCSVIRPGKVFLRRLYALIAGKPQHYSVRLTLEHRLDLNMWLEFLEGYNGIDFFEDVLAHRGLPLNIYTDASQSLGFGALFRNSWFSIPWPSGWWSEQNITLLEFIPVVLAIEAWGSILSNRAVIVNIDNNSLVSVINSQTSKEPLVLLLLRRLVLTSLKLNIQLISLHIAGTDNKSADLLSRLQVADFKQNHPTADESPTEVPNLPPYLASKC